MLEKRETMSFDFDDSSLQISAFSDAKSSTAFFCIRLSFLSVALIKMCIICTWNPLSSILWNLQNANESTSDLSGEKRELKQLRQSNDIRGHQIFYFLRYFSCALIILQTFVIFRVELNPLLLLFPSRRWLCFCRQFELWNNFPFMLKVKSEITQVKGFKKF